jgi:hypothetical protein
MSGLVRAAFVSLAARPQPPRRRAPSRRPFSSVSVIVDLCSPRGWLSDVSRRRMLAAALAVMACRPGKVFAQPEPRPPMPPPRHEIRPHRPRVPGNWHWSPVTGGGLATIGFGCPGAGGASDRVFLQVGRGRSAGVRPSPKRDFDAEEPAGAQVMRRTNADSGAANYGTRRARLRRKAGVRPRPRLSAPSRFNGKCFAGKNTGTGGTNDVRQALTHRPRAQRDRPDLS